MMKIPIIIETMARIITFVIEIKLKFITPIKYSLENINKQNEAPLKSKKKSFKSSKFISRSTNCLADKYQLLR